MQGGKYSRGDDDDDDDDDDNDDDDDDMDTVGEASLCVCCQLTMRYSMLSVV